MMQDPILITGATGFVGRYLLRELLAAGHRVVALVRAADRATARNRLRRAMAELHVSLPADLRVVPASLDRLPQVLERRDVDLLRSCRVVIHAAASVTFRQRPDGEPRRSNVEGTQRLFETMSAGNRLEHWVQLSTAYATGRPLDARLPLREETPSAGRFRNPYEASKWQAEQWLRRRARQRSVRLTICRPSIVVGEYDSGRTFSYEGFYRPLRLFRLLAHRADAATSGGSPALTLRLELSPEGIRNLVPVDWVARQVIALAARPADLAASPEGEGADVFHLVPHRPTRNIEVVEAVEAVWGPCGVAFSGPVPPQQRNRWERLFHANLREIGAYWSEEVVFDPGRLTTVLGPEAACPVVDRAAIERLLRFADADRWGARQQPSTTEPETQPAETAAETFSCRQYIEQFLPDRARRSSLGRLVHLNAVVGLSIEGAGGGQWRCRFCQGDLVEVVRGAACEADVVYRGDVQTLADVVRRRCSPSAAFFDRRFDIEGDIELGLKLATIFDRFVREHPFADPRASSHQPRTATRSIDGAHTAPPVHASVVDQQPPLAAHATPSGTEPSNHTNLPTS